MKLLLKLTSIGLLIALSLPLQAGTTNSTYSLERRLHQQAPQLPLTALRSGLKAYQYAAKHHLLHQHHLAIADMKLASNKKRLWIFDMNKQQLIFHTLVAHGKNSGALYANHFSNRPDSLATSLGVYITGKPYYGNDGLSLRLYGKDKGFNNNAYTRDIVLHGARYVSQTFVDTYHRLGRSWGCPAVSLQQVKPIIHTLEEGALFMIYYPQRNWLQHSQFLA